MNKVIVVSPHPDDETLGCGGTIIKYKAHGDKVYWLIMTNILTKEGYSAREVRTRQKEIDAVAHAYGFDYIFKLDFPTTKLDTIPKRQLIKAVGSVIEKVKPKIVYLPNRNDVHSDHRITFDVVSPSIKSFRCPFVKKVMMYEVVSETEFTPPLRNSVFVPNSFSDISKYFDKKISIMKMYKSEVGKHPFPRSLKNIKAIATFRGATAGCKYAEGFMVLKEIW